MKKTLKQIVVSTISRTGGHSRQALPEYAPRGEKLCKILCFCNFDNFRAMARMPFRGLAGERPGLENLVKHYGFRVFWNTDPPEKKNDNPPKPKLKYIIRYMSVYI